MKLLSLLSFLIISLSLTSCAKDDIFEAKKMQIKAAKVGFEWRDMGKMIKKAEAAFLEGDTDKASEIAQAVILHGEMALKQAEEQENAGPTF